MGPTFPIYPPEDLNKLDKQKRAKLKAAIHEVLHKDPEVKKLVRKQTDAVFQDLVGKKPYP